MHSALGFGWATSLATLHVPPVLSYYPDSYRTVCHDRHAGLIVIG